MFSVYMELNKHLDLDISVLKHQRLILYYERLKIIWPNSKGRKAYMYVRKMGAGEPSLAPISLMSTRTNFSAIFSHLDNNWAI